MIDDPASVDADIAAVLGAGLRADGTPTNLLARRVDAGVDLYQRGAVTSLVMSGADDANGDQPGAMARRALDLGVPPTGSSSTGPGSTPRRRAVGWRPSTPACRSCW